MFVLDSITVGYLRRRSDTPCIVTAKGPCDPLDAFLVTGAGNSVLANCYRFIHYVVLVVGELNMSMGDWWNETDREKRKYWEYSLSKCHFIHHKFHVDWPGI